MRSRRCSARGFLGRVAAGEEAALTMGAQAVSDSVERLVETMQGAAWSGGADDDDVLALYAVTCDARATPMLPVSPADVAAIRHEVARLTAAWDAVPIGGTLTLHLDG